MSEQGGRQERLENIAHTCANSAHTIYYLSEKYTIDTRGKGRRHLFPKAYGDARGETNNTMQLLSDFNVLILHIIVLLGSK